MKKFAIALAIVLGLVSSIVSLSAPVSYRAGRTGTETGKAGKLEIHSVLFRKLDQNIATAPRSLSRFKIENF